MGDKFIGEMELLVLGINDALAKGDTELILSEVFSLGAYLRAGFPEKQELQRRIGIYQNSVFRKLVPIDQGLKLAIQQALAQVLRENLVDEHYGEVIFGLAIGLECFAQIQPSLTNSFRQDHHSNELQSLAKNFIDNKCKENLLENMFNYAAGLQRQNSILDKLLTRNYEETIDGLLALHERYERYHQNTSYSELRKHYQNIVKNPPQIDNESDMLIVKMRRLIPMLIEIEKSSSAAKRPAVQAFILDLKNTNQKFDHTKTNIEELKTVYYQVLETHRPKLDVHRNSLLFRVITQGFRLIGYVLTAGGLYMLDYKKGNPAAWSAMTHSYHKVQQQFHDVLNTPLRMGLAFA